MINKIGIGTANFGSIYGVKKKSISVIKAGKIIQILKKNKIKIIDTSSAYLKSEETLGDLGVSKFNLTTKIAIPNNFDFSKAKDLEKKFLSSLNKLRVKSVYALLFQNCAELLKEEGNSLFNIFLKLKKKKLIKKIGFSVYSTRVLNALNKKFKFDIIQIPLNILDQRFLKRNLLKKLKKKNIEIHSRSSFLQGLLLMDRAKIPKKFQNFDEALTKLNDFLKDNNLNKLGYLLNFPISIKEVDYVIVGIDSPEQLSKILSLSKIPKSNLKKLSLKVSTKLIDPRLWKKK